MKTKTTQEIDGFTVLEFTDRWKSMSEEEQINELRKLLKEQATALINKLHAKAEFVTYKKDGGHGLAVPVSEILEL